MADDDKKDAGKGKRPGLDAADLKARLGLTRRRDKTADTSGAGAPLAGSARSEALSIADARRRAEEAMAAEAGAGLSEADFRIGSQDNTPLPQQLPERVVVGAEPFEGQGRGKRVPMLVGALLVLGLVFFLGKTLGEGFAAGDQMNELNAGDGAVLKGLEEAIVANQDKTLERVATLTEQLDEVTTQIDKIEVTLDKPEDILALEGPFAAMLPMMQAFVEDKVQLSPTQYFEQPMHSEVAREVATLTAASQRLYDQVSIVAGELASVARDVGDGTWRLDGQVVASRGPVERSMAVMHESREVTPGWACMTDADCPGKKGCGKAPTCGGEADCRGRIMSASAQAPAGPCPEKGACAAGFKCDKESNQCVARETAWCAEAEGDKPRSCSHGLCTVEVPHGVGKWMQQAQLLWPRSVPGAEGQAATLDWRYAVLLVGGDRDKDIPRVASTQIATIDITAVYEEQAWKVRVNAVNRLAMLFKELHKVAKLVSLVSLKKLLQDAGIDT